MMKESLCYWNNRLMGTMLAMPFSEERLAFFKNDLVRRYGDVTRDISGGWGWSGKSIVIAALRDSKDNEIHINYYYTPIYLEYRAKVGVITEGL